MREMTNDLQIRPEVAHRLEHYVYLYIDPRTEQPFYVGKVRASGRCRISSRRRSRASVCAHRRATRGLEGAADGHPRAWLRDEETAFRIEAAVIDLPGVGHADE